jgi:hypothetical protein
MKSSACKTCLYIYLNGRRSECENFIPCSFSVSVHVYEDVDPVCVDLVRGPVVTRHLREIDKVVGLPCDLLSERSVVVGLEAVAKDLHPRPVVQARDGLHEVARGVVAKVGAHVSDLEFLSWLEAARELEWWLVQHADLLEAELRVSVGDQLAELVAERVEHRVVRVHRRQTVLVELVGNDADKVLAARRVVCPIADNLKKERGLYGIDIDDKKKMLLGTIEFKEAKKYVYCTWRQCARLQ